MYLSLSILNSDLENIEEELKPLSLLFAIHMDIMDGKFVPETSFDEKIVERCTKSNSRCIIDTHLMVVDSENYFEKYKNAGSDYITFHYETGNVRENINKIHEMGLKAGVAINPDTDVKLIEEYLKEVDLVLVMSVYPGRGGQSFIETSVDKLKFLYEYKKNNDLHYMISVDGGINAKTYMMVKPYCDLAVTGSAVTKAEDEKKALETLTYLYY